MATFQSKFPDVAVPSTALDEFIMEHFDHYSESVAMVDGINGHSFTFKQIQLLVRKIRVGLADAGFKQGDVFAIFMPNCLEYVPLFLAVVNAGGVVTTIPASCTVDEIVYLLENSEAKYFITVPPLAEKGIKAKERLPNMKEVFVVGEYPGCKPYASLLDNDGKNLPRTKINLDDVVFLPYSSGTTGLPKGIMLTHRNLVSFMCQCMRENFLKMNPECDSAMALHPFSHVGGLTAMMTQCLRQGVKMITLPQFQPQSFLRSIQDHKITYLVTAPPLLLFLAKSPLVDQYDLSSVKSIGCGAAPQSSEVMKAVAARLGVTDICDTYGLTETSAISHIVPRNVAKYGPTGLLLPNMEMKIVKVDSGKLLGPGEDGEIWLKGPQVMKGYLKNPEATAAAIDQDGFFHTGDIGHVDEEGYLWIMDRLKELIKCQACHVPPAELEALLLTHPEVLDAAVIGVPDQSAGELPRAYVVRKTEALTAEEVANFVADRVAPHKRLQGGVEFLNRIPKSTSGKILRRELRKRLQPTV